MSRAGSGLQSGTAFGWKVWKEGPSSGAAETAKAVKPIRGMVELIALRCQAERKYLNVGRVFQYIGMAFCGRRGIDIKET